MHVTLLSQPIQRLRYILLKSRRFSNCAPRRPGAPRDVSKCFSFNFCVLFFPSTTKLLGQIVIKLSGSNYLIYGSVRYFVWSSGAVKHCWDTKGVVNRENLGTADLSNRINDQETVVRFSVGGNNFSPKDLDLLWDPANPLLAFPGSKVAET
jgi:hypothetical protein